MKGFLVSLGTGFAVLLVFVLGALFDQFIKLTKNSDDDLNINQYVQVSISAKPDIYRSNPSFYATDLSEYDKPAINTAFSAILALVKTNDICTGGSYYTSLAGNQNSQKQELRLNSKLRCEFNAGKMDAYNELINGINDIIKQSPVKMHVSAIIPSFSDTAKEQNEAKLKELIFEKINQNESSLSTQFSKRCVVKNISLNDVTNAEFQSLNTPRMLSTNDEGEQITPPELSDIKIQIGANVDFSCK